MSSTPGIEAAAERSDAVKQALEVARQAHLGQLRRGSDGRPYIDHPLAVAELLLDHGYNDEVLAAGLLHDVVEKSDTGIGELRERFGERIAGLVEALTEDAEIEDYVERKEEQRERVAGVGGDALAIFAADKQTNVAMLREAYALIGESVSDELAVSLDLKIFVWENDLEMLFNRCDEMPLTAELADEMIGLWGDRFRSVRYPSD